MKGNILSSGDTRIDRMRGIVFLPEQQLLWRVSVADICPGEGYGIAAGR